MRLFVVVILFVIVLFVCTDDPTQGVMPSPQEDSRPPNSQPQDSHQNPASTTVPLKTPTGDSVPGQIAPSHDKGDSAPTEKEGDGKLPLLHYFTLFISLVSAGTALRSMLLTDKTRRITERAYIAAEQWELEGDYIVCRIANRGRTPATLMGGYTEYSLWNDIPSLTRQAWRRVNRDFQKADLPAQGAFPMQVGDPGRDLWKGVKERRDLTLRVIAHLQYRDVFGETWDMHSAMEYDARISKFIIADIRTSEKQ